MSQDEIMDWLRKQRLDGSAEFFSIPQIKAGICASGLTSGARVYEQCLQLYRFGVLEIRRSGALVAGYRLRKKYVGKSEEM